MTKGKILDVSSLGTAALLLAALLFAPSCSDTDPPPQIVEAMIEFEPGRLDFGQIFMGAGFMKSVRIKNLGKSSVDLRLDGEYVDFEVKPSKFQIPPAKEVEIQVRFHPQAPRSVDTKLAFRASRNEVFRLPVTGQGVPQSIRVDPAEIDFGEVPVGESRSSKVTIQSLTDGDLDLRPTKRGSFDFPFDEAPILLGGRVKAEIEISFVPAAGGVHGGWMDIFPCGGCTPVSVSLRGFGTMAELEAIPFRVDFGAVPLAFEDAAEITVRNRGAKSAALELFHLEDDDAPFLLVESGERPEALEPGMSWSFQVRFAPATLGAWETAVVVGEEDMNVRVPILGRGGAPRLAVEGVDFGIWPLEWSPSPTASVRIENQGEPGQVKVESLSIEGPGAESFLFSVEDFPLELPAKGLLTIPITLLTHIPGKMDAELVLRTDRRFQEEMRVPLRAWIPRPECELAVTPSKSVRLGLVDGEIQHDIPFEVVHRGDGECLVWGFGLDGDEGFSIAEGSQAFEGFRLLEKDEGIAGKVRLDKVPRLFDSPVKHTKLHIHHSSASHERKEVGISAQPVNPAPVEYANRSFSFPDTLVGARSRMDLTPTRITRVVQEVVLPEGFSNLPGRFWSTINVAFAPERTGWHRGTAELRFFDFEEPYFIQVEGWGMECDDGEDCDWPSLACVDATSTPHETLANRWMMQFSVEPSPTTLRCDWVDSVTEQFFGFDTDCNDPFFLMRFQPTLTLTTYAYDTEGRLASCTQTAAPIP